MESRDYFIIFLCIIVIFLDLYVIILDSKIRNIQEELKKLIKSDKNESEFINMLVNKIKDKE
jgi:hypothetical protein